MAKIALIIALVFLLAASTFSFLTRSKVNDLSGQVTTLTSQRDNARQAEARAEADLKTTKDDLAKSKKDLDDANTQITSIQGQLSTANDQITALTASNTALQTALNNVPKNPIGQGPVSVITQPQVDALNSQITEDKTEIAELNQVKETLTNKEKDAEARADDLENQVKHYRDHVLKNGLEGEVLAYNPAWNFVVISIGDQQGAVANAEMILTRGDEQIGKVRITSVEPSTSVADIIPGSLARGVRVQPGDHVIYPGS